MIIYAKHQFKRAKTGTRSSPSTENGNRIDRFKNRKSEREKENEEGRERERKRKRNTKTDRQTNRQKDRQQTDTHKDRQKERQADRTRDKQADRKIDRKESIRKNGRVRERRREQRRDTYYKRPPRHINLWMLSPLLQPLDAYTLPSGCSSPMTDPLTHTAGGERSGINGANQRWVRRTQGGDQARKLSDVLLSPGRGDRPAQDKVDSLDPITVWGEKM